MRQVRDYINRLIDSIEGCLQPCRFVIVIFLTLLSSGSVYSQKVSQKKVVEPERYALLPFGRSWSIGVGGGPTLAMGDLKAIS